MQIIKPKEKRENVTSENVMEKTTKMMISVGII